MCDEKSISEIQFYPMHERLALKDPVLFSETSRVLPNLLDLEEHQKRFPVDPELFQSVQTELQPNMRRIVANWMLEVSIMKAASVAILRILHGACCPVSRSPPIFIPLLSSIDFITAFRNLKSVSESSSEF